VSETYNTPNDMMLLVYSLKVVLYWCTEVSQVLLKGIGKEFQQLPMPFKPGFHPNATQSIALRALRLDGNRALVPFHDSCSV